MLTPAGLHHHAALVRSGLSEQFLPDDRRRLEETSSAARAPPRPGPVEARCPGLAAAGGGPVSGARWASVPAPVRSVRIDAELVIAAALCGDGGEARVSGRAGYRRVVTVTGALGTLK